MICATLVNIQTLSVLIGLYKEHKQLS